MTVESAKSLHGKVQVVFPLVLGECDADCSTSRGMARGASFRLAQRS